MLCGVTATLGSNPSATATAARPHWGRAVLLCLNGGVIGKTNTFCPITLSRRGRTGIVTVTGVVCAARFVIFAWNATKEAGSRRIPPLLRVCSRGGRVTSARAACRGMGELRHESHDAPS